MRIQGYFFMPAFLAAICFTSHAYAQELAAVGSREQKMTGTQWNYDQTVTLRKYLEQLGATFGVSFGYIDNLLANKRLRVESASGETLESSLKKALEPLGLDYTQIDANFYVIKNRNEELVPALPAGGTRIGRGQEHQLIRTRKMAISPRLNGLYKSQVTVSGTVTFREDNQPAPGVSVVSKSNGSGTSTGIDGSFTIQTGKMDTLVFSFIGYVTLQVPVSGRGRIDVQLEQDISELEEVIVVGYGTVRKENLTSSISKISSEAIEDRPIPTLGEAFAGQLAGVRAQNTTGIPGSELQIRIRGVNTINGNSNPLYVIDGVPREGMGDINPADVASIQILKDASATAIYGARGANGVVLIETKQGTGAPVLNFNAFYGFQDPEKFVGMMNKDEWLAYNIWYRNESWLRQGGSMKDPMSSRPANLQIPEAWMDPSNQGTDWQNAITEDMAPMQSYQLSTSAKGKIGNMYLSGG